MRRFSVFHPIFMSFYSKALYRDVAFNWPGYGFVYIIMILSLIYVPLALTMHTNIRDFVDNEAPPVVDQLPVIAIVNGEAVVDVEMPYHVKTADGKRDFLIIDTTGQVETLDNSEADLLLKKNTLVVRKTETETSSYQLSQLGDFTLDRKTTEEILAIIKKWFAPIMYAAGVLITFLTRVLKVLAYAGLGVLMARSAGAGLSYTQLLRIASIASTPVMILDLFIELQTFQQYFIVWAAVGMGLTLLYLRFGINSCIGLQAEQPPDEGRGTE